MAETTQIAARLREFGKKNFGTMTNFAKALDMLPQTLNNYLSTQVPIGATIRERLRALGCDIEWLITGNETNKQERKYNPEEEAMLNPLKQRL